MYTEQRNSLKICIFKFYLDKPKQVTPNNDLIQCKVRAFQNKSIQYEWREANWKRTRIVFIRPVTYCTCAEIESFTNSRRVEKNFVKQILARVLNHGHQEIDCKYILGVDVHICTKDHIPLY